METGLNDVLLPKLLAVVDNIIQRCYTRVRSNNAVDNGHVDRKTLFKFKLNFFAVYSHGELGKYFIVRYLYSTQTITVS